MNSNVTFVLNIEGKEHTRLLTKSYDLPVVPLPGMNFVDTDGPSNTDNKELGYKVKIPSSEGYCVMSTGEVIIEIIDESHIESNKIAYLDYVKTYTLKGWNE